MCVHVCVRVCARARVRLLPTHAVNRCELSQSLREIALKLLRLMTPLFSFTPPCSRPLLVSRTCLQYKMYCSPWFVTWPQKHVSLFSPAAQCRGRKESHLFTGKRFGKSSCILRAVVGMKAYVAWAGQDQVYLEVQENSLLEMLVLLRVCRVLADFIHTNCC